MKLKAVICLFCLAIGLTSVSFLKSDRSIADQPVVEISTGVRLPAACIPGEIAVVTSPSRAFSCLGKNTWTEIGSRSELSSTYPILFSYSGSFDFHPVFDASGRPVTAAAPLSKDQKIKNP